jgi:hypothetical protein
VPFGRDQSETKAEPKMRSSLPNREMKSACRQWLITELSSRSRSQLAVAIALLSPETCRIAPSGLVLAHKPDRQVVKFQSGLASPGTC